ncbi:glycosyltransferase family 2 protein [Clostridium thermobutyricum]|uniref:GalNAc(5)-diNAcBac-PP-undecaprenol beta-1,3-glucosyltransferase n=1 Tax=Clostridium thermobutyricum DSM 4928 TaxID=1121339 RepID=A0A1V4SVV5_9CLOT|nr:glycosyltransferase family 2 protein [Clostridium thermobutyricum]OPX47428.1 GalNAc(5)-diNAcBac-PP-undecaprenol beta-1,3-glucosyltransferase [Clostridium thermobutyricum DSM 4928]
MTKFCTVFTPTYNRGEDLISLYNSLKAQDLKDFEWIVVDDGSEDNTRKIIENLSIKENSFEIKYIWQKNGGKHRAINNGINYSNGKLFFIVDSDDTLESNAISKIKKYVNSLPNVKDFAGVSGLRKNKDGQIIGNILSKEYIDCTNIERAKYNLIGDKAEVYFTEILKKYKFPEFEGENFLTECIVWNKIAADGYKIRWFNEPIYICDYRDNGLSKTLNNLKLKNPKGYLLNIKSDIELLDIKGIKKLAYIYSYYETVKSIYTKSKIIEDLEITYLSLYLAIIAKKTNKFLRIKL